ncbi:MAG TPA: HD domain-containing phosphohydrolase [Terriglobales bacterium]|nr:HD domain-containing phosphohydrolase [Terriglobales bacterium]
MPSRDMLFEDRLNKEYDLRGRTRLAAFLSVVLYIMFIGLDAIYTPELFLTFLCLRLGVVAVVLVLIGLINRTRSTQGTMNLAIILALVDAAGIAVMIQILGGFKASYYQGLNIIVMGMMVLIPLAFRETLIIYASVWLMYVLPSLAQVLRGQRPIVVDGVPVQLWRLVMNNLVFLTSIIVVGAFGSYLMDSIRRRELRSRLELERTTAQLQESNVKLKSLDELKMQFFANVNHELRTPLTLMLAPLKAILENRMGKPSAELRDTLETMQRNGYRLLKLINNLLDLTKLEEGKMRLKIKPVNLIEFTGSLLSTVKPLADQKQIKLYFQHPPHDVELVVDPDQFEKVVLNLLSNGLKFTPKGGRITVYIEDRDSTVTLTVEDTGVGIPANMLETIFNRFSQVDGSMSRPHEGTGIGLSLAREIVAVHQGTIRAESELGRGSRFIVDMLKGDAHFPEDLLDRRHEEHPVGLRRRTTDTGEPRVQDIVTDAHRLQLVDLEQVDLEVSEAAGPKTHDALILAIDDNAEVLKLMKMLLGDEFDVEVATSAEKGLALMGEKSPDLVLCDVMMPGMDGHAFCRAVKADETLKHTPIILVTARSGSEMLAEGMQAGADDYIAKPFDSVELKARIRALLRIREVESELALVNRNLKMRTSDLVDQQNSLFLSTVKSLVSAIDAKDEYTRHHSTRVTDFTLKIAESMGFSEKERSNLELAALLHDVGKIAVPEAILNKPGRLTENEFALIKEHPSRGESILRPVIELKDIAKVVRAHHEHYDGTGYPDGLKGREIPLGARIMAVADAYDSITSERPYRKAASHRYAVKEIIRCSGAQFDPEVVEHFLAVGNSLAQEQGQGPAPEGPA